MTPGQAGPGPRGLLVDFGGVLTSSAGESFRAFERAEGLPKGTLFEVIAEAYRHHGGDSAIARFERGDSTAEEFGEEFAALLRARGHDIAPENIHARIFSMSEFDEDMWSVVHRAREHGVRTGLLSNSWGTDHYPIDRLGQHFDAVVVSGEVGLRKPDPAIYRLAAERLGIEPPVCAFVDDLERNVDAARDVGMFGVVHTGDVEETARALEGFLGLRLVG